MRMLVERGEKWENAENGRKKEEETSWGKDSLPVTGELSFSHSVPALHFEYSNIHCYNPKCC